MNERRDITDVIRTADAQRRETPPAGAWARIAATLPGGDAGDGGDGQPDPPILDDLPQTTPGTPALNGAPRPTRAQLLADARARRATRREPRLRRGRNVAWLAAAAAVMLLLVTTWALQRAHDLPEASLSQLPEVAPPPPNPGEELELVPESAAARRLPADLYDGVVIREGKPGRDELQSCAPC